MEKRAKEGVVEREGVMYVGGHRSIARLASALANETRAKIVELLADGPKDLDHIAKKIGQSKANVSSQIRRLEEAGIVSSVYIPGERGIKKMVELRVEKVVFNLVLERGSKEA
ncbi:MAG: winged helix-turn-helix domain-containing protein [Acidilobaceae archaeon]|nr:winged helix-turn-helix domain-containing protein [Acidilobaceae archaeon]